MTELVVVADLKSAALNGRVGSNPTPGTHSHDVSVGLSMFQKYLKNQVTAL